MTDTTDIKALREGLVELLDHVDSYGGKCWLFPEDVRSIISSLDQLEAERQRADYLQRINGIQETTIEVFRHKELAELKGDQVPVEYQMYYHNHGTGGGEWCRVRTKARYEELQREHAGDNDFSFRTLFTAPQKPVVLPKSHYVCGCADRFMSAPEVIAAIEAAGGTVKDGE